MKTPAPAFPASLMVVLSFWYYTTSIHAMQHETCQYPPNTVPYQAVARSQACFCDGANSTLCQPNDLCFSMPPAEFQDDDKPVPDFDLFTCIVVPCDDVSGNWVYLDLDRASDLFLVVANVAITQSNCDSEIVVTTDTSAATFYAALYWQEVYWLQVFESKELRDEYSNTGVYEYDMDTGIFLQNFEGTGPQCPYSGNFVGFSQFEGNSRGLLYRATTTYTVGQTLPRNEVPFECPDGYPKQWGAASGNSNSSTPVIVAPSTSSPTAALVVLPPPVAMATNSTTATPPAPVAAAVTNSTTTPATTPTATATNSTANTNTNATTVQPGGGGDIVNGTNAASTATPVVATSFVALWLLLGAAW